MNPVTRMLMWREWRERRITLVVCLLWVIGGAAYAMTYERAHGFRTPVAYVWTMGATFALLAPIFVAMRTTLGEVTDRTRPFSEGLPVSPRCRGWIRWAGGSLVLAVPLLCGALVLSAGLATGWVEQIPGRSDSAPPALERESLRVDLALGLLWTVTGISVGCAMTLHSLLSVVNTRMRSETQAGFVGAAVTACWLFAAELKGQLAEVVPTWVYGAVSAFFPHAMVTNYGYGEARGSYGDLAISGGLFIPLVVNTLLQLGLGWWFVRRYERQSVPSVLGRGRRREPRRRLVPWLPTRGAALTWYSLRTSLIMCLPGLAIACLLTLFTMKEHYLPSDNLVVGFADALPHSMWVIGMMWAILVGSGLFAAEVDPRVSEFWRTRPIAPGQLFFVKFFVGLAAVLLVLDGTAVAISIVSPNWGDFYSMNWPYVACMIPQHAVFFAIAVAMVCWLRRPVLGGLSAVVVIVMWQLVSEAMPPKWQIDPVTVYNSLHGGTDFLAHGYPAMATMMGSLLLLSAGFGYIMLRRYDERRIAD